MVSPKNAPRFRRDGLRVGLFESIDSPSMMGGHAFKFEVKLAHEFAKGFIGFELNLDKLLHQALQVRFLRWWLWGLKLRSLILETGRMRVVLWRLVRKRRAEIFVG